MSSEGAVVGSDATDGGPTRKELSERLDRLEREKEAEIERLGDKIESQQHTIDRLVDIINSQPTFLWSTPNPRDLKIVFPNGRSVYQLGDNAMSTLPAGYEPEDLEQMELDIQSLKRGEVDTTDLVGGVDPELPIEEDLGKFNDETRRSDLSENEERAVRVFREFDSRSKSWNGVLKIDSADVRNVLEENESDVNNNDIRRTMKMLAKKTSERPKDERDPQGGENLLTLDKSSKRNELHADKEEWSAYTQEVEERYSP